MVFPTPAAARRSRYSTASTERGPAPTYFAVGRISFASRFCSRMCADQPATRAHVNIGVNRSGGTSARSSTTACQNSTLVGRRRSGERVGGLHARGFQFLGGAAQHPRPGVFRAVDAMAEAHQAIATVERVFDPAL